MFGKKAKEEKEKQKKMQKMASKQKTTSTFMWILVFTIVCLCAHPETKIDVDILFECAFVGVLIYAAIKALPPAFNRLISMTRNRRVNTGGNQWNNDEVAEDEERRRNARLQAEERAAAERQRAANEAIFYQNQADANRGTYAGYQAQNRANDARSRS
ncbi:MAG: hypothetical protein LIP12_09520 [Clostridiales bacterium]|nr:hypothetical protein [Clostridiales bacterium]